jgi:hypothetical protein
MPEIVEFTLTCSKAYAVELAIVKSHRMTRTLQKNLKITLEL